VAGGVLRGLFVAALNQGALASRGGIHCERLLPRVERIGAERVVLVNQNGRADLPLATPLVAPGAEAWTRRRSNSNACSVPMRPFT
jgi:hypothetical protein